MIKLWGKHVWSGRHKLDRSKFLTMQLEECLLNLQYAHTHTHTHTHTHAHTHTHTHVRACTRMDMKARKWARTFLRNHYTFRKEIRLNGSELQYHVLCKAYHTSNGISSPLYK